MKRSFIGTQFIILVTLVSWCSCFRPSTEFMVANTGGEELVTISKLLNNNFVIGIRRSGNNKGQIYDKRGYMIGYLLNLGSWSYSINSKLPIFSSCWEIN